MHTELIETLFQIDDPEDLKKLIQSQHLDIQTVQMLKDYSAKFYGNQPAEAVRLGEVALQLGMLLPSPALFLGQWTLANALIFMGRHHEAIRLFERAREGYLAFQAPIEAARVAVGQVGVLALNGQCEAALFLAHEVEKHLEQSSKSEPTDVMRLASLWMNMGICYGILGQYEEVLEIAERQEALLKDVKNESLLGQIKQNQAYALMQMNAVEESKSCFYAAEKIFSSIKAPAELARLYMNLGMLSAKMRDYAETEVFLQRADQLLVSLGDMDLQRHHINVWRAFSQLHDKIAVEQDMVDSLRKALAAFEIHGPFFYEGITWLALGHCYLAREEWSAADDAFIQARRAAEQGAERSLDYQALYGLGRLHEAQSQFDEAIHIYEETIERIELIRHELHIETFRAGFLTDKLMVYQDLATLYSKTGRAQQAFLTVERAKARLLAEKLTFRLQMEAEQLAETENRWVRELAAQLQDDLQKLDQLSNQIRIQNLQSPMRSASSTSTTDSASSSSTDREKMVEIQRLEEKIQKLTRRIQQEQPFFSTLSMGESVDLSAIQGHLSGAIFLQYHIIHDYVWVFVIDDSGILCHKQLARLDEIDQAREKINIAIERVLTLLPSIGVEMLAQFMPSLLLDIEQPLATLYRWLIQPIKEHLSSERSLIISPDSSLHYIPFHALYDGQSYLIEQYSLHYVPSATVFQLCIQHRSKQAGMLLLGHTGKAGEAMLTNVRGELKQLVKLFPASEIYLNDNATTTCFLDQSPHNRFLHIASHARFRADNLMLSSISLEGRPLTLAEIARLQLDADLVALSGCETGQGQLHGADMLSLAGGFLGTGVSSLLVSLWRVEDSVTARLMKLFYQNLLTGQSRAEALRTAQCQILQSSRQSTQPGEAIYAHPAFWAPFILIGNGDELELSDL